MYRHMPKVEDELRPFRCGRRRGSRRGKRKTVEEYLQVTAYNAKGHRAYSLPEKGRRKKQCT